LLVENRVTIFFQGHDHVWVRQQLDGVIYQTLPEPADPNYTLYNDDAFLSGDKFPNTGYTRVGVSPDGVRVDYVRTYLPDDESAVGGKVNGATAFSYWISGSNTGPAASFTVSPGSGGAPLTVTFADTSTGAISLRQWDFGDGTILSAGGSTIVHTFSLPGSYTVSLTVSGTAGASTSNMVGAVLAAAVDSVGDGICDWWRARFFGGDGTTTNAASSAFADPDRDGANNYEEYVADTDPTATSSRFQARSIAIDASGFTVCFQSSAARLYTLCYSTDLLTWTPVPSQSDIRGSGGVDALTDPSPAGQARFYRVEVKIP
jgi:PKD repeat protein